MSAVGVVPRRRLGRSGIEVSAVGLGCWAIGGPFWSQDGEVRSPMGWGDVDDAESIRAIHRALDLGANFFDTANNYGAGHSERLLGEALRGRRDDVVIATKFGSVFDEEARTFYRDRALEMSLDSIRGELEGSLRRLDTEYVDLYLLHDGGYDPEAAPAVVDALEALVAEGKIRSYGWSTDDPARARVFAEGPSCAAVEHRLNVAFDAPDMLALCEELDLASVVKSPLQSGFLSGKFDASTTFPENDGRHGIDLSSGAGAARLAQVEALRPVLTRDGRSHVQGLLSWILTRSERSIPIPGFKSVAQAEENVGAAVLPPLTPGQMREVEGIVRP
jgi:aryl-alcohol dehydrogenase-like predicted oxidoreductase